MRRKRRKIVATLELTQADVRQIERTWKVIQRIKRRRARALASAIRRRGGPTRVTKHGAFGAARRRDALAAVVSRGSKEKQRP